MALTVTATGGGSTAPSLLMKVWVLTSAAAVAGQTGATKAVTNTSTTPFFDQSITTTVTGSQVFGVMANGITAAAFTADANTTIDTQISDGSGSQEAVWRATNTTGSPGATTLGASSPTGDAGAWVAAEVLANGTLTIDGSTPASVNGNSAATTASFNPPGGSLLVATVVQDGTNPTLTMSNSGTALNWHVLVTSNAADGFTSSVVVADIPNANAIPATPIRPGKSRIRHHHGVRRQQQQYTFGTTGGVANQLTVTAQVAAVQPGEQVAVGQKNAGQVAATGAVQRSIGKLIGTNALSALFGSVTRSVGKLISTNAMSALSGSVTSSVRRLLSASVVVTASVQSRIGRLLTALMVVVATVSTTKVKLLALLAQVVTSPAVTRQVTRLVSAQAVVTSATGRALTRLLSAITVATAALNTVKVKLLAITAQLAAIASEKVSAGRLLSAATVVTGQVKRSVGRLTAASAAVVSQVVRQLGKSIAGTAVVTATMNTIKVKLLAIAAQVAAIATEKVSAGRLLSGVTTVTGQVKQNITRLIGANAVVVPQVQRQLGKLVAAITAIFATMATLSPRLLALVAQVVTTGTEKVSVGLHLQAVSAATASILRTCGRKISGSIVATGSLIRRIGTGLSAIIVIADMTSFIKVRLLSLTAQVAATGAVIRKVMPQITASAIINSSVTRSVTRPIQGTFAVAGQTVRVAGKKLTALTVVTATASVLRVRIIALSTLVSVSGILKRAIKSNQVAYVSVVPSVTRRITSSLKAAVTATISFFAGRAFLVKLITAVTVSADVIAKHVQTSFLTIFKLGNVTINWILGGIKKNWRIP